MQVSATHKYLRIAPRKVRLVADLLKGKRVSEAQAILRYTVKGAAEPMGKVLRSAIASATHNLQLQEANLYVFKITVNEGPKLKRYRPRARGRAYPIQKKTSHITLILDEITPTAGKPTSEKKGKGPAKSQPEADNQAGPPQSSKAGLGGKPRFRPTRDMTKPKAEGGMKKIFRRKAI